MRIHDDDVRTTRQTVQHRQGIYSPFSVFLLTYTAYIIVYATRKPFSVVKSIFQQDLQLPTSTLGGLDASFLASYAVGQFLLPSRLKGLVGGDREALVVAFCGSGAMTVLFALGSSNSIFFATFIMNGLFHSIVFLTLIKFLVNYLPISGRGQLLGLWCTAQQIGSLTCTAVCASLVHHYGWRATILSSGILVMVCGVWLGFSLPPNEPVSQVVTPSRVGSSSCPSVPLSDARPTGRSSKTRQSLRESDAVSVLPIKSDNDEHGHHPSASVTLYQALKTPGVVNLAAAFFCVKCVRYSMVLWAPYYLASVLNNDVVAAGYTSMLFDVGGIFGSLVAGAVSERWCQGRHLFVALWMSLLMAGAVPLFLYCSLHHGDAILMSGMHSPRLPRRTSLMHPGAWASLCLLGFSVAGPDTILAASGAHAISDRYGLGSTGHGVVTGLINGTGSLGAVFQSAMTAWVTQQFGWSALFTVLCLLSLLSAACLVRPVMDEKRYLWKPTARPPCQKRSEKFHPASPANVKTSDDRVKSSLHSSKHHHHQSRATGC